MTGTGGKKSLQGTHRSLREVSSVGLGHKGDPTYVLAHQQSCDLCHKDAVKFFQSRERRIRQREDNARKTLEQEELEGRRALYKQYSPLHIKCRAQVDAMIAQRQLMLTIADIRREMGALEEEELEVREEKETEMLKLLRAIRRCCYRRGWEKQAQLEEMAKQELERVEKLEAAEKEARRQEQIRRDKLTLAMLKQLNDQESRVRHQEESFEFKEWVRFLLKHKEGAEKAASETNRRLEQERATERNQLEQSMIRKRNRIEDEERDARGALKLRYQKQLCVLKERPIIQKLNEMPALEESYRQQKVAILLQESIAFQMTLAEKEESIWRKKRIEEEERSLLSVVAEGKTLRDIERHEECNRKFELTDDEEAAWGRMISEDVGPELLACQLVDNVLCKFL